MKLIINGRIADIPDKSGVDFTTDESLSLDNNKVLSVTVPVQDILTPEQFNELSEEDKNNGFWIIDDGDSGINAPSNTYCLEEIRIGTLFGKTLYRRGYEFEIPSYTQVYYIAEIPDNMDIMKSMYGYCCYGNSGLFMAIPEVNTSLFEDGGHLIYYSEASDRYPQSGVVWVEYTKITDSEGA